MGVSAAAGVGWPGDAWALEPDVPMRLQVDLLNRVIPYDRNFGSRVHGELTVAVVTDDNDTDSMRTGAQLIATLDGRATLGGFRLRVVQHNFTDVAMLTQKCRQSQAGIVYVTPGIRVDTVASALTGLGVLSVGMLPDQVKAGLVLGFGVRSGKPRLLVNLSQARRQQVDFRADFLRMAEVVG